MTLRIILLALLLIVVSACSSGDAGDENGDPAVTAVEAYLEAKVSSDENSIRNLICSELESSIEREVVSFASVEASIEDMSCTLNGDTVTCTGQIVALYGTENRTFPLRTYRVVQEDGEWRWCGEGQ